MTLLCKENLNSFLIRVRDFFQGTRYIEFLGLQKNHRSQKMFAVPRIAIFIFQIDNNHSAQFMHTRIL